MNLLDIKKNFKKGEYVHVTGTSYDSQGEIDFSLGNTIIIHLEDKRYFNSFTEDEILNIQKINKGENIMNSTIINMFAVTKEAVLVDKWFGKDIENLSLAELLLKGKENELLKKAKSLEKESLTKR